MTDYRTALIVGAGSGLSASLARLFAKNGMQVALAARSIDKLAGLAAETGAQLFACDASQESDVEKLFSAVDAKLGAPDVVVYNASARARGAFADLVADDVERRSASRRSADFSSRSRRCGACCPRPGRDPVHRRIGEREGLRAVGAVRDGQVRAARARAIDGARACAERNPRRAFRDRRRHPQRAPAAAADKPDALLDPDAIAETYLHVLRQPKSAWTWEIELRPWVENF